MVKNVSEKNEKKERKKFLRKNAILVDDNYSLLNQRTCVIQGRSSTIIRYNGWNPGTVYIRQDSHATITAKNMSFVIVHMFDNATVDCQAEDKAYIVVLRHGENTKVNSNIGNIKVKDELGYLS